MLVLLGVVTSIHRPNFQTFFSSSLSFDQETSTKEKHYGSIIILVRACSMSLVQHVSAVEGVDRDVDFDIDTVSFHQLGRRNSRASLALSYDPTPFNDMKDEERLPPIGAYEVPRNKRIGMICSNRWRVTGSCATDT
jgi:hypothetical protein